MGFTKSRWLLELKRVSVLSLLLVSLTGWLGAQSGTIRATHSATSNTCETARLPQCTGTVDSTGFRFTDDGTNDGNYVDPTGSPRTDTVEICPVNQWSRVKVVFTDFDLAAGDTLNVYQGNKAAVRGTIVQGFLRDPVTGDFLLDGMGERIIGDVSTALPPAGTGSGVGVARAFGGWVDALCNPSDVSIGEGNPSGCLTFIFRTNGDNNKGAGWDAWVGCEERNIQLTASISDAKLRCTVDPFAQVTIPAATVTACGAPFNEHQSEQLVRVFNQHGDRIVDEHTKIQPISQFRFGAGQYSVVYKLKSDTTKTLRVPFSVQVPALVGNDDVTIPLGAACGSAIEPDFVLENPCDTIPGIMYYNITVTIPGAHGFKDVVLTTTGTAGAGPVMYPMVTGDTIAAAGQQVCGVKAKVEVERVYYERFTPTSPRFITGTVRHTTETHVRFLDEQKPWVEFREAPDSLIGCHDLTWAMLGKYIQVSGFDNCDRQVTLDSSFTIAEKDPCFDTNGTRDRTTLTVVYGATDDCGNRGVDSIDIVLIRPDATDERFVAKARDVRVQCNETGAIPLPGLRVGPWVNGQIDPTVRIDTIQLDTANYVCGYILVPEMEDVPSTDCGSKKYVYYSVLDWCRPGTGVIAFDTVFIENTDTIAPVFAGGQTGPVRIELDHFSCTYDAAKLTRPSATDNCDMNPSVRIGRIRQVEEGTLWTIAPSRWDSLVCDTFFIQWIAEDDCHEQVVNDTIEQQVIIQDVTKPSAACVDQLNVSIPNEWGAIVHVEDIDAGSFDACGIKTREIRIKGTNNPWDTVVIIGCEYVHPDLQIEMRVTDKKGNQNVCWLDVIVEDKIGPICNPLENLEGDCEDFHDGALGMNTDTDGDFIMDGGEYVVLEGDLLAFYNASFGDPATLKACEDNLNAKSCGELTYEQQYQLIEWPCGEAKARRRYRARDWQGNVSNWAVQDIVIVTKQNWKITFPGDWEGSCGDIAPTEAITIDNGPCDLLAYEVTADTFEIPGDACFKIARTYHVINWCTYEAGQEPVEIARIEGDHGFAGGIMITSEGNEDKGYFTYVQVLKVHDDVAPVVTVINPDSCITGIGVDALPYGEEDITPGSSPFECDEPKTWRALATDCSSNISFVGRLYNATTGELVREVQSSELTYVVNNKDTYYAEFWAYDNCGNSAGARGEDIKFWDCKKPTPYVLNGVAVELMPTGMVQVWATDLNQNSFDNCTDQSKLDFRIWADFLGEAPTTRLGVENLGKVITFDCNRVGTNIVYIYVMDEEGNFDYAQTYVIVQDNMNACTNVEAGGMVAGTIVNPQGENVESVNIQISGGAEQAMTTGADGQYMFMLEQGVDYTVTPTKDINPLNGVSTFDLVLISKHILGITTFDSPYKYIAADVNKSGTITAFDMVQLRQLILNITETFPANDSWRFVDAAYEFTSANPASEGFGEAYSITGLNTNMENVNFVGVKVGDVNGNAQANSLLGAESRSVAGTFELTTAEQFVSAGQQVTVSFTADQLANIEGYQFTMNYAGTDGQIGEGVAKAANFNTNQAAKGIIATSWNGEAGAGEELFELSFVANRSGMLSELLSITSEVTQAEAYSVEGELQSVGLRFTEGAVAAGFELSQNTPNPFGEETVIGFNLPQAGQATLTVMDAQGKVLRSISADYGKGYNQIVVKARELGATGVLYYQLESADNVATKKMIVIE